MTLNFWIAVASIAVWVAATVTKHFLEKRHARLRIVAAAGPDLDNYGDKLGFKRFVESDADFRARMRSGLRPSTIAPIAMRSCHTCGKPCDQCRPVGLL